MCFVHVQKEKFSLLNYFPNKTLVKHGSKGIKRNVLNMKAINVG